MNLFYLLLKGRARNRWRQALTLRFLLVTVTGLQAQVTPQHQTAPASLTQKEIQTLQSLKKIAAYPLYTMTYYGDYGLAEYLKVGIPLDSVNLPANLRPNPAPPHCTCFATQSDSGRIFGRNFDWRHHSALVLFTDPPDGYASVALVDNFYCGYPGEIPLADPTACRGLLQAPYRCLDGLNAKGVAIGLMAVPEATLHEAPNKVTISNLAVVRLVLDYADDTAEAVALIRNYNIKFYEVNLHYQVADRQGLAAIIEFVGGEMKVIYGSGAFQVCTNFILTHAQPKLAGRCWRYDLVTNQLTQNAGQLSAGAGMELLQAASV
ncbi:carcinine hydrolase/isopenicillin-N N-acyltransferase family protein, partial [candidate division KSB1 bacterium]|nr:carcinine hydrolase/isopenicillin-N N-acyltransferase family protein [candidate division KSB1 bacterium]